MIGCKRQILKRERKVCLKVYQPKLLQKIPAPTKDVPGSRDHRNPLRRTALYHAARLFSFLLIQELNVGLEERGKNILRIVK